MKPRKLHVCIVEWAADNSEAGVLQQGLAQSRISIAVRKVASRGSSSKPSLKILSIGRGVRSYSSTGGDS
jgi:hypothetical protein